MNFFDSRCRFIITVVFCLMVFLSAGFAEETGGIVKSASSAKIPKTNLLKIDSILIYAHPTGSLEARIVEDAVAVDLLSAGIDVIGRQKIDRIQKNELKRIRNLDKDKTSTEIEEPYELDILHVANLCGAKAVMNVTVLADGSQKNIYDSNSMRVREVRNQPVVHTTSLNLVDTETGKLLVVAFAKYSEPTSLGNAAKDLTKALLEKIQ